MLGSLANMEHTAEQILAILDDCCEAFTFPILDNGYVYLAAARLTAFRSESDWSLTIEVAGFAPRGGTPETHVYTFGSELANRRTAKDFVTVEAFDNYLANNPNNESEFFYPFDDDWIDSENCELVAERATHVVLRGVRIPVPTATEYQDAGVELDALPRIAVYQLVRALAHTRRREMLANDDERRHHVPPSLKTVLSLDEWCHPDIAGDARPSGSETFRQLAEVLVTGDATRYRPSTEPNTHWRNWPDGGTL